MLPHDTARHALPAASLPTEGRFLALIRWSALGVLLLCLGVTYFVWDKARRDAEQVLQDQFDFKVREIHTRIQERLVDYRDLLLGAAGLFAANDSVDRRQFHAYIDKLRLQETYPGIQGLGFAQLIAPGDLARRTAEIRAEGFPQFSLRPDGPRDLYSAIIYLEPFDWRNQRAFGYDMYTEPIRRAAMARARDQAEGALSAKVTLVQETEADVQNGFLMYLPVYRNGAPHATEEERRQHLLGWVYSPFRINDLMTKGVLGHYLDEIKDRLNITIYDGDRPAAQRLMFDLAPDRAPRPSRFLSVQTVSYLGHSWTIAVHSLPHFEAQLAEGSAHAVALSGSIISLLLAFIVWLLSSTNTRAIKLARQMSKELVASAHYSRGLIEASLDPLMTVSPDGRIMDVNEATLQVTGRPRAALIGQEFAACFTDADKAREAYRQVFSGGQVTDYPLTIRHQDGHATDVIYNASVYRDETGQVQGVLAAARDVTQRLRAERALHTSREKLKQTLTETIGAMATIVELRDPYTAGHQRRAADLSRAIAREMALPEERTETLYLAALIYEIGKIHIPAEVLSNPAQLDDMERELIRTHANAGFEILRKIDFPWPIAQIVLQHHERLDGSGYPQGLQGAQILPEARILAVADVVEAMLSHRPYRPALGLDAALGEITRHRGVLYDPAVVDACLRLFTERGYRLPD